MSTPTREQLRGLLLQRLPEHEARGLEDLLRRDERVAELLRQEEMDLADDYAFRRLGVEEREAFERYLLMDDGIRERVRVSRALQGVAAELKSKGSPWDRWPVRAITVFVVCLFAIPLFMRINREARSPSPTATKARPLPAAAKIQPSLVPVVRPNTAQRGPRGSPTNIVLLTDFWRPSDGRVVRVAPGAARIRLQAETTSRDPSVLYGLAVEDESGARIFTAQDLRPVERGSHVFVEVSIPSAKLGTGWRMVTLQPQEPGVEAFMWRADVQPASLTLGGSK